MIDTTDVLKQYEINHEINGQQWHLLTGSIDDVVQLARFSFFGQPSMRKDILSNIHTETVFLVIQTIKFEVSIIHHLVMKWTY